VAVEVLRHTPALLLAGGTDAVAGSEDAEKLWTQGRALGAVWTFGIQPGQGHGAGLEAATAFMLSWMEAVIRLRVSRGEVGGITQPSTWRGDRRSSQIHPGEASPPDLAHTVWLPDEKTAKLWQEVVGGK